MLKPSDTAAACLLPLSWAVQIVSTTLHIQRLKGVFVEALTVEEVLARLHALGLQLLLLGRGLHLEHVDANLLDDGVEVALLVGKIQACGDDGDDEDGEEEGLRRRVHDVSRAVSFGELCEKVS